MRSLSVLIVEDEILIAETIATYLRERGHTVHDIAISYNEALEALKHGRPDIILLDIRLYGNKTGLDLARYLKDDLSQSPPFVYLTSQFDKRIVDLASLTEPDGYLTKPIDKRSLWTTIESAARKSTEEKKTFIISDGKINHKIVPEEIIYIKSDHVYIKICKENEEIITVRSSLQNILKLFKSECLIQCHRSYIININRVTKWTNDSLILSKKISIPVSRSRRTDILEYISKLSSIGTTQL